MIVRRSKRIQISALLFCAGLFLSTYNLYATRVNLYDIIIFVLVLCSSAIASSIWFSEVTVDDNGVTYSLRIALRDLEVISYTSKIKWHDVTYVDGEFSIFPPYVISIEGLDAEKKKQTSITIERFSPDIDKVYDLINRHVERNALSENFKNSVPVNTKS